MSNSFISKKHFLATVVCFLITMLLVVGSISVFATGEEATVDPQTVIQLIDKLPLDFEQVTIQHKDDILAAKEAFNALSVEQKLDVPTEKVVILNSDYSAVNPLMLGELVAAIKKLPEPKKLSAEDEKNILGLYRDYCYLDEEAKSALSKEHKQTLINAVNALAPDKLLEEDRPAESTEESENEEQEEKSSVDFNGIWQIVLLIFVTIIVLLTLVAVIILIIRIIKLNEGNQVE